LTRTPRPCSSDKVLNTRFVTLPNGLRVLILELPHVHSVSHALFVRTGPRYETPTNNGISHLVEHLVFRGTRSHPSSLAFHTAVEALGGETNGLTQRDASTIHMTVPPRAAVQGLELLAEVCVEPLMDGIHIERSVVIEEILDTLDSEGNEQDLDTIARRIMWQGAPIAMPVAGEVRIVEGLSAEACRRHFRQTFVGENSVLCIAGRVDPDVMEATARSAFGAMPQGRPMVEGPAAVARRNTPIYIQASDDSQVSALLSFPAPHENHEDFPALLLLKRVLDDGFGSRLRQAICEQRGLAYSLSASLDAYRDVGAFDIEFTCAPRKLETATIEVVKSLRLLAERGLDAQELERARTRHLTDLEFALDDPSEMAGWFGTSALIERAPQYDRAFSEVMGVSCRDIQRLVQGMLEPGLSVTTLVGPVSPRRAQMLEVVLGTPPGSTCWIGEDEEEECLEEPVAV
jgi:predicted Zn-dependent peptidase